MIPVTYMAMVVAVVSAGAGATISHKLTSDHYKAQIGELHELAAVQAESDNLRARASARDYEAWKAAQRPRVITLYREVERAIQEAPEWSADPIPDGVRQLLEAAAAGPDPAEPARAVPATPATPFADQR